MRFIFVRDYYALSGIWACYNKAPVKRHLGDMEQVPSLPAKPENET